MPSTVVPYALTTKEKVKSQLKISGTDDDTFIDAAISYVTDWIESQCGGRRFQKTTYTGEKYDATGQQQHDGRQFKSERIYLRQYPLISVAAVEYNSGSYSAENWIAFSANDYVVNLPAGYVEFFVRIPRLPQVVRFTYDAGFLIDFTNEFDRAHHTLPFDLTALATNLTARMINARYADGIAQESTEGQSIVWAIPNKRTDPENEVIAKYADQSFA